LVQKDEKWIEYGEYLRLKKKGWMITISDIRDGLGRWHNEFADLQEQAFQEALSWQNAKVTKWW
jgi:hypothetical protein